MGSGLAGFGEFGSAWPITNPSEGFTELSVTVTVAPSILPERLRSFIVVLALNFPGAGEVEAARSMVVGPASLILGVFNRGSPSTLPSWTSAVEWNVYVAPSILTSLIAKTIRPTAQLFCPL